MHGMLCPILLQMRDSLEAMRLSLGLANLVANSVSAFQLQRYDVLPNTVLRDTVAR